MHSRALWAVLSLFVASSMACNCPGGLDPNGTGNGQGNGTSIGNGGGNGGGNGEIDPPCEGLECDQVECQGSATTRISGVVTIPAGNLPLPGATVYVPNAPIDPIIQGASCDRCDADLSGSPLVRTETDIHGEFVLEDMPVGEDIPVVIQVGKWRRQITLPAIDPCVDHPLDPVLTRLPRSQAEGDIPRIALTTGGADALECLLLKIGLDPSEFTPEEGDGRVNFFVGRRGSDRFDDDWNDGADFTPAREWWDDIQNLLPYDIVLHSCEGNQDAGNKSEDARRALQDFADLGGRVFLSHWHNIWLQGGPDEFESVALWNSQSRPPTPTTGYVDMSFEKGEMLAEWLFAHEGSDTLGELEIVEGRRTLDDIDRSLAQAWITLDPNGDDEIQYFSFNTPVGAEDDQQCGRVVFSDIHVSSGDRSRDHPFPTGCTSEGLTPQEKALVFMLFDLSGCIVPDCLRTTCEAEAAECGEIEDGCGGVRACGECDAAAVCLENACVTFG